MRTLTLKSIVSHDSILLDLDASSNVEAIQRLVALLAKNHLIPPEFIVEAQLALMKREALRTTGIGKGISIPHARVPFLQKAVGALGISKQGIDFRAVDNQLVYVVFLFLSPEQDVELHMQILAMVGRLVKSTDFIEKLRSASTLEEVLELLDKAEEMIFSFPKEEEQ